MPGSVKYACGHVTGDEEESLTGLDISILKRLYTVGALLTGCAFFYTALAHNTHLAVGVLAGGLFGVFNTWLIAALTQSVAGPRQNPILAGTMLFLKVPFAYGILILAFIRGWIDLVGFSIGFVLFLAGMMVYAAAAGMIAARAADRRGDDIG